MKFCPRFYQTFLFLWEIAANCLDRIYTDDGYLVLIVCVEVWTMMGCAGFSEHSNNNTKEAADFGHVPILEDLSMRFYFMPIEFV